MGSQAPPAGWYQDPGGSGLRYWDGSQWTQHVRSQDQPAAQPVAAQTTAPQPVAVAPVAPAAAGPPAGWHPDPTRRFELRYWDGVQWSEHVATNAGWRGTDPVAGVPGPGYGGSAGAGYGTSPYGGAAPAPGPAAWGGRPATGSLPFRPIALLGAAIVALSGLFPWLSLFGQSANGFKVPAALLFDEKTTASGGVNMGVIMVVAGLVLAVLAFVPSAKAVRRIVGTVTAGVMVWFVIQVVRGVSDLDVGVSPLRVISVGVYAAIVGSVLAAAG